MKKLVEIYCFSSNFVKLIDRKNQKKNVGRPGILSKGCYVTLSIYKNILGIKTNRQLYEFTKEHLKSEFPRLPSYQQFNEGICHCFKYFICIMYALMKSVRSDQSNVHFVDSTILPVCKPIRMLQAKMFKHFAKKSKTTTGWFYGFKLHLIINNNMEIEAIKITDGATHDLNVLTDDFLHGIVGWLIGDKGYLSDKKAKELALKNIILLTKKRKNSKVKSIATKEQNKLLTRRPLIEAAFHILKNSFSLVSSFARSLEGFFSNVFAAIIAFSISKIKDISNYTLFSEFLIS